MTINQKLEKGEIYSLDKEDGFTYIGLNVYGENIFAKFIEEKGEILTSNIKKENTETNRTNVKSKDNQYLYSFISPNENGLELDDILNHMSYLQLAKKIHMSKTK